MLTKTCPKCLKNKEIGEFSKRAGSEHLFRSWCKICCCQSTREWQKTPAGREARKRAYKIEKLFHPDRAGKRIKAARKKNPVKFREYDLKKNYGLSTEEWEKIFALQNRLCAICGTDTPNNKNQWHTDHCHKTKIVRGILCGRCNSVLGFSSDSIEVLQKAIKYLEKFTEEEPDEN